MHRLFVALRPPHCVRTLLCGMMAGAAHARWQSDDQIHITLRFIGDVDSRTAEDIGIALLSVRHPPFNIALDGIGTFDRKGRIESFGLLESRIGNTGARYEQVSCYALA